MRTIFDYLVGHPHRLTNLGKTIAHLGWFFSLAGLFGWFHGAVIDAFTHEGHKQLAEIYPGLPTWWVPESFLGGVLSLSALVFGAYVMVVGRRVDRLYHAA